LQAILHNLKPPDDGEILAFRQIQTHPPVFRATVTTSVKKTYIQYIRNTIRHYSGFQGVPILVRTRKAGKRRYVK
jgi:predicted GTPase